MMDVGVFITVGMGVVGVFAIKLVCVLHVRVPGFPIMGHFVQMAVKEGEPDQDDEHSGGYAQPGIEDFRQDVA
jgi:hypothetical protein